MIFYLDFIEKFSHELHQKSGFFAGIFLFRILREIIFQLCLPRYLQHMQQHVIKICNRSAYFWNYSIMHVKMSWGANV